MKVRHLDKAKDRERLIHQYVTALDAGDLEEIAEVLAAAGKDPELDAAIELINQEFAKELGI